MEWSIQQIARLAGTTSRALRHYQRVGLLEPSRVGANGYRYYDERALLRLQRVLLLRELGLRLAEIARVLDGERDHARELEAHLEWLGRERDRLDDRIEAVRATIDRLRRGEGLMPEETFKGFDPGDYREEVAERWGREAQEAGERWWGALNAGERAAWLARVAELSRGWVAAWRRGEDPGGAEAQSLARRHCEWLGSVPGAPAEHGRPSRAYVEGLADLYVEDERFAANYGGPEGAAFVRVALRKFAYERL